MPSEDSAFRPHGGYRQLKSFRAATIIYDGTVAFCDRFIDRRSRTHDQMVQAARSGRQNIAEGSRASATSARSELKLTNVARASLDELLLDFEDYLRQKGIPQWDKDSREAKTVRSLAREDRTDQTERTDQFGVYAPWLRHRDSGVVANTLICLIHQANFLLDRQLQAIERDFTEFGGFSERLSAKRLAARDTAAQPDAPACPNCGNPMVLRTARQGRNAGRQFWGCSSYPQCRGTRPFSAQ